MKTVAEWAKDVGVSRAAIYSAMRRNGFTCQTEVDGGVKKRVLPDARMKLMFPGRFFTAKDDDNYTRLLNKIEDIHDDIEYLNTKFEQLAAAVVRARQSVNK